VTRDSICNYLTNGSPLIHIKPEKLVKGKSREEATSKEAQKYFESIKSQDIEVVCWTYGSRICWEGILELGNQFPSNSE
jgi:hypothetical protein